MLEAGRVASERIEIADDEVDRGDAVGGHVGLVLGIGRVGEDSAMDLRMKRDDPMPEDRRDAGPFDDVGHRYAGVGDGLGGTSR